MVRVLEFVDGTRWIARLRMPSLDGSTSDRGSITAEFTTASLVISVTDIPTPFIHAIEPKVHCLVKASFMLMDCLEGNVGMDLGMEVPRNRKASFFNEMAHIHVRNLRCYLAGLFINILNQVYLQRSNFLRFAYQ